VPLSTPVRWIRFVRPQDPVWILLFAALGYTTRNRDIYAWAPLAALGVVQLIEPRIPALESRSGRIFWIALKLLLGFLLIGYTDGIGSRYWLVMLLPVVAAGTTFGILGTLAISLLAAGVYLIFLLYIDWTRYFIEWPEITELVLRVVFLAMVGTLANTLAEDLREQSRKYRRTAEQLSEANVQIREAEEAVRRSDRLAALGQLSAGLAHELRNPLGTIKASAEMLGPNLNAENEVAREVAGFISTEVDRANSLITRFLQFARPLQVRLECADLTQVLDRAIAMAAREAPGIAIYKNYSPEIPPFPLDAELMERVFYNLVLNAAQASPEGGAVTVKTRSAQGTAEISVIDRGSGIEPKSLDSIFNPFFTTKPSGVGLGLAIVAKIVDEHGGKITVESEPAKGSVFRVLLPMERSEPTA
jgi:two-component system, NtrC family, sensor histidine kinase HydH